MEDSSFEESSARSKKKDQNEGESKKQMQDLSLAITNFQSNQVQKPNIINRSMTHV